MPKFSTTQTWTDGDQVTSAKLAAIVTGLSATSNFAADSTITVDAGAIKVGTISAANINANAVTTAKILNENVTAAKLADDAVETAKIDDGAVTAAKLASDTATWAKTPSADRAIQTDMQSESPSHFVSPDVLKYHPGVAKAYGRVAHEPASFAITNAYNVTSATDGGTNSRVITLAVTMANTTYTVITTPSDGGTSTLTVSGKTTTQFTLTGSAEGAGRYFDFVVFGTLA